MFVSLLGTSGSGAYVDLSTSLRITSFILQFLYRPDETVTVDWTLKSTYLSAGLSTSSCLCFLAVILDFNGHFFFFLNKMDLHVSFFFSLSLF